MKTTFRPLLYVLAIALCAGLTQCGQKKGKALSDFHNPTEFDSLLYYYGEMQACDYLQRGVNDTTMLTEEQRQLYLDGVRAGMDALRQGAKNEIYNQGVRRGARMARKILAFEKAYDLTLDEDVVFESLEYVLKNPGVHVDGIKSQENFYRLYDRVRANHRNRVHAKAMRNLADEAADLKLTRLDSNLYYRITHDGGGEYPKAGDAVFVAMDFEKIDGTNLGMPATERVVIGAPGVMPVMNRIYSCLAQGSSGVFATTAYAVFGVRAELTGLKPDEVLIITAKINDIEHNTELPNSGEPSL